MYYPSTRLLNILDLLRTHGQMTATELAAHLDVDQRTVRRYMLMLEDLGMPVETERGRHGGYRLRTGYKLPPIVFSDDEVLALSLGLLFAQRLNLTETSKIAELAVAKLERAMPTVLQEQMQMLNLALVARLPLSNTPVPAEFFLNLSRAVYKQQQVQIRYRATDGAETTRVVDPYGLVYTIGFWYVAGYCHLRQALRTFRLDRLCAVKLQTAAFVRPNDFDVLGYVEESIARKPWVYATEVRLFTTLDAAKRLIHPAMAILTEHPQGVTMHCDVEDLSHFANFLLGLPCALQVCSPVELRDELEKLAAKALLLANS